SRGFYWRKLLAAISVWGSNQLAFIFRSPDTVLFCTCGDLGNFLVIEFTHNFSRSAQNQRAIGNNGILRNKTVGADKAVLANFGAIEHHSINSDQTLIADGAAVEHDLVTHNNAV